MIASLMSLHLMAAAAAVPAASASTEGSAPVVAPGTRVRVKAGDKRWVGRLVESGDGTVSVLPEKGPVVRLRLADVSRLEVSQGHVTRGTAAVERGFLGLFVGATLGAALGRSATNDSVNCLILCDANANTFQAGVMGAALGTVIGAAVGAAHPPEQWRRVEGLRARVVLQPQRRGLGAALALSF